MKKNNISAKKHLIIGAGEVGSALREVLAKKYNVIIRDKDGHSEGKFDVLHIAYPPIKNFIKITQAYIKQYKPGLVIIHSTVPVGTTRKVSASAVHSPIRGVHPRLADGIRTFVKYLGGTKAGEAAKIFESAGVKTQAFMKPEATELLKILDTTYYGWNIMFNKEVKRICDSFGVDFDEVYTMPNISYNQGYTKLGMGHVVRPVLKYMPGKIGGHCVINNCFLLDDWLTKNVKERNKKY